MWITNGGFADLFTIFAKVDGEQVHRLPRRARHGRGQRAGREEARARRLVDHGADARQRARCRSRTCSARSAQGHKVAFNILNFGRVKLGARNMSGAKQALNHAVKYAKERRQFGKAIAEFGLIKQKLAEMAIRVLRRRRDGRTARSATSTARSTRSIAPTAPRVLKTIEGFAVECSINKVWTSEALAYVGGRGAAGVRRQRLLARVPARARLPRRAHHAHLRGHQRDQPADHPDAAAEAVAGGCSRADAARAALDASASVASRRRQPALAREREFVARAKRLAIALLGQASARLRRRLEGRTGSARAHRRRRHRDLRDRERAGARREDGGARRPPRRRRGRHRQRSTPTMRPTRSRRPPGRSSPRSRRAAPTARSPKASSGSPRTPASTRSRRGAASPTPSSKRDGIRSERGEMQIADWQIAEIAVDCDAESRICDRSDATTSAISESDRCPVPATRSPCCSPST